MSLWLRSSRCQRANSQRTRSDVCTSYRLNIFGFPKAAALDGHNMNPGLLDQRKAVEWVCQNIHAFGGDAEKMILFGQSAG